jgi:hypothetical protein
MWTPGILRWVPITGSLQSLFLVERNGRFSSQSECMRSSQSLARLARTERQGHSTTVASNNNTNTRCITTPYFVIMRTEGDMHHERVAIILCFIYITARRSIASLHDEDWMKNVLENASTEVLS